jgi:hypothetical protein
MNQPDLRVDSFKVGSSQAGTDLQFAVYGNPSQQLCAAAAALDPANPFYTNAYIDARRMLGYGPWLLALCKDGRITAACPSFLKSGRLSRSLEIPSLPQLPEDSSIFWNGLLDFCRRKRISHLQTNSYASTSAKIAQLRGEIRRTTRYEYVLDLQTSDLWSRLHKNHRWMIHRAQKAGMQLRRTREPEACEEHARVIAASMERRHDRGEEVPTETAIASYVAFTRCAAGELFQALLDGKVISSALVLLAGDSVYAHSSGTSVEGRDCGASHFLWFEIAKAAQQESRRSFNLGGTDQPNSGLARFKTHFGARRVDLESAEFFLGSPLRKKLGTALQMLRDDPAVFLYSLKGRWSRMMVFSVATNEIARPAKLDGVICRKLSDEELQNLPSSSQELQQEQIERFSRLRFNGAYAVFCNNELAHISWLFLAKNEALQPPRLLRLAADEGEITACVTLPDFRGKGLYPFAIQSICEEARQRGIRRIFMKTKPNNVASQRGIRKAGLRPCGSVLEYHPCFSSKLELVWRGHRWRS